MGTSLGAMIAATRESAGYTITEEWMQGRTTYGGLSAALCLAGTLQAHADLQPLRSAQIAFIGPAGGDVTVQSRVLRQGRSMTYIEADLSQGDALATRCLFAFGSPRESVIRLDRFPMPVVPAPDACELLWRKRAPLNFLQQFDARMAYGGRSADGTGDGDIAYWFRLRDPSGIPPAVRLLALADTPPPAVMPMFTAFAPISTATWQIEVLDTQASGEGWHLIRSTAETGADGYTSQRMGMWDEGGRPVLAGRQMVALFG
ncbi:acyl-CoA thioesterase domain-containing protein [Sphingosinicella soli]|uniref:Acyl-CoA thioesterase n=1 Tax=Sphingosinicella soli TaxID=333708 RepID=A0A7W7B1V1_9SPHN|nr:acyl-CoA thioesterase [Sphingosinicella soli]